MRNKGFVLVQFVITFAALMIFIESIAMNEFRKSQERKNALKMDYFSLMEIEVIHRVKQQFLSFNPKNFTTEIGSWTIQVAFNDETALITFNGDHQVIAQLDFDMVFKNVLNYTIQNSSQSNSD